MKCKYCGDLNSHKIYVFDCSVEEFKKCIDDAFKCYYTHIVQRHADEDYNRAMGVMEVI